MLVIICGQYNFIGVGSQSGLRHFGGLISNDISHIGD